MSKQVLKIEASTTGTKGLIRIVDYISMYSDTSSSRVREIVDDFIAKGTTEHEVYINSRGGSTMEAAEIVNELNRLPNVSVTVGAVAASAATYICSKFKTRAFANSQLMIHRPKLIAEGDIEQIKAEMQLLENTTADYKASYAKKMGKTEDEIEAMFTKGDYWMTAQKAKEEGLVDEIIDEKATITAESLELLVACGAPIIPKDTDNTVHTMKNRNQIIASLGLAADATDEQIEQKIKDIKAQADTVEAVTAAQKTAEEKQIKTTVAKAVADKKITADLSEKYEAIGKTSGLDNLTAILDAMPGLKKPSDHFENPDDDATQAKAREKWTLEDYQEKDPEALAKMMVEDKKKFDQLQANYFGK